MSWAELLGDRPVEVVESELESRRFGLRLARVSVGESPAAADRLPVLLDAVGAADADLVVVRYPARLVSWAAALARTGRDLLPADTLLYWRLRTGEGRRPGSAGTRPPPDGLRIQTTAALGRDDVERFVGEVFGGYDNHYAADPLLDRGAALDGYRDWAARTALAGGAVPVTEAGGDLVALATTRTGSTRTHSGEDPYLEIELAGVHPDHQGRGVYSVLLAACEDLAASKGTREVVISTQAHNVGVQRAWARYGFEPVGCFTTLHALRPGLLPVGPPTPRPGDGSAS